MPFIAIKTSGRPLDPAQVHALQQETTRLMAVVMGKKAEVTAVLVEQAPPQAWAIGGRPLSEAEKTAAHVDIKITQGTNTAEEKAEMLARTRTMLTQVLPDLSEVSYTVIDEVPATDWGYGGWSQDERKRRSGAAGAAARPLPA